MTDEIAVSDKPHRMKAFGRFLRRFGPLRLFLFFLLLALAYAGPQVLGQIQILPNVAKDLRGPAALAVSLLACVLSIGVYGLLVGLLERRHAIELNFRLPHLVTGLGLAVAMFALVYAGLFGCGAAKWQGFGSTNWLIGMAAMAIISGICEELIFRGGVFRITEDMFGTTAALTISAGLFGLLHLGNPHATLIAGIAIALEAGILLGAAYAATRNLWLPIGIHIGWNFSEGGIFGAAVSGSPSGHGLLDIPLTGPDWLTGGSFGPEASVVTIAVCTAAGVWFAVKAIRSGHWCRIGFRMKLD